MPETTENTGGSSLIAYAKVDLWEGELEGIINTDEKLYALRTLGAGIKVNKIKFDTSSQGLLEKSDFFKKFISPDTTAKIGLEYKGNTLTADGENNSYIRAFIDIEADAEKLKNAKIGEEVPFDITLKKLAIGYLKYGKDSKVTGSDFRKWLENEKKEVVATDPEKEEVVAADLKKEEVAATDPKKEKVVATDPNPNPDPEKQ
ncbi:hypothetical protein SD427_14425 [Chryseobacterium sp. JJR-5R]|uniref:hypothetical protein n=1 Tax=Chryseobacterium sp. JJR-5R TaxID=3093923 RepID=UPI002A7569F5|nr:hypothetical protein [Chryseobacterium sp. JJR-5R]WPO81956.1 hypothetical protein SD427_14425 [Chryseobacterium sp. JJR-5R]